jgi:3-hydroxyacyl-CoA dehydrogenase
MKTEIKKVAIIGAGVMGAGIAAQCANAGVEVLLLDIVPKGDDNRNAIAENAIARLKKSSPAALMHPSFARRITPGNIEDDLKKISSCDWILEAVIERLDIKQNLYRKIEKYRKKGAAVSSNTSTLPLDVLTTGMPKSFREHFFIAHFFNPPRYMRLLEFVAGPETRPEVVENLRLFGDERLGKSVVTCHDTPGFVANRIGTYWLHASVMEALRQNIGVEEADAVLGRPAGVPKTGVFGLLDLVGLDLMPHILESLANALPKNDPFQALGKPPPLLHKMIEDGYTGRKGKGGFYRLNKKREKEVISLKNGAYSKATRPKVAAALAAKKGGLKALVTHDSPEGRYAWVVISNTLAYAATLAGEIADDIETIDRAMRLGYNWKYGPFELIDRLGTDWFAERLTAEGRPIPPLLKTAAGRPFYRVQNGQLVFMSLAGDYVPVPRPEGVLLLGDIKRRSSPLAKNMSASLWDIGDGVLCLEFHSKMNALDPFILSMMNKAIKIIPAKGFKALVIHNEGNNFSVGANVVMLLVTSKLRLWPLIRWILRHGQTTFNRYKYAPFPVVGAPSGMALGGGCEVLLHCNAVEAHAETYMGLVEAGVGIVPGWGGCKEMLGRAAARGKAKGPMQPVLTAFQTIALAQVGKSAYEARDLLFLSDDDNIVMNRDRVLASAKARALKMAATFTPPEPYTYRLPGPSGLAALKSGLREFVNKGMATPHDVVVATQLGRVLTGGRADVTDELTEEDILRLERDAIVSLTKTKATRARIVHILKTGKPLRN